MTGKELGAQPAHPDSVVYDNNRERVETAGSYYDLGGLTKREAFAMAAMAAMLAHQQIKIIQTDDGPMVLSDSAIAGICARGAILHADALCEELVKDRA